jgi:prolyl oligopeptidase
MVKLNSLRRAWLALLPCLFAHSLYASSTPPVAPVEDVVDTHYGTQIHDPYRYMEDFKAPRVQEWVKAQAEHTQALLAKIPGRDALLARIKELDDAAPYRIFNIRREPDGRIYYYRRGADENVARFYMREGLNGTEKLLVDPKQFDGPDGQHASISFAVPSPDGKHVAFGVALAGSEQTTLRVLDASSGKLTGEAIDRMEADYTDPYWLPDGSGFVYSRRRELPPGTPPTEAWKLTRSYVHKLGATSADADAAAFAKGLTAAVPMEDTDFPSILIPPGAARAVGKIKHGDANELTLYSAPPQQLGGKDADWKKICDMPDKVQDFAVQGDSIYLLTAKDAPRFKVLRTSLSNPDIASAQTLVPQQGGAVIQNLAAAKDALYITLAEGPRHTIWRLPYESGAKLEKLEIPGDMPSADVISAEPDVSGVLVSTASWVKEGAILAYDPQSRSFTDTGLKPRGKYDDVPGYESKEVMVMSHDGVLVPLTIIHRSGIKLDGSNPTIISGYGSYGASISVNYDATDLAWLERGGVFAIAHVRGGGELGKQWHLAGQKLNKPNTWKDLIACAEHLVKEGYTSPQKLAVQGGSAGGILCGRSITERPDLFAGAIINVGCTDMIRFETTTNGVPNIPEFGTITDPELFRGLLAMSAYHHVKEGEKYPAVMLTHGVNDPRVEPWNSAKMCARLQAATASGKPVVFRVDYSAGHGIGSTKLQRQEQTADQWAFLLWQMGVPEFQPK